MRLDYNLLDLDQTALHVHMPSALNENVAVKERRTNLTDVLKSAIEREPDRDDLRMKLLEMYYAAASTNARDSWTWCRNSRVSATNWIPSSGKDRLHGPSDRR